jgi:2-polyprenyl-3-methyl-5-hydroxy-6-metoxy-1,4-benzoquinol methylase
LEQRLAAGCDVADVGCGGGRILVRLAQAFPNSRFTGIDITETAVELARQRAAAGGVADTVQFVVADGCEGLPGTYDVVAGFGILHHAASPVAFLRSMRGAQRDGGMCLLQEANVPETLAEMAGSRGTLAYMGSLQYCLPAGIAAGGPGLGLVVPETRLRELALEAGFDSLKKVASAPLWAFYSLGCAT